MHENKDMFFFFLPKPVVVAHILHANEGEQIKLPRLEAL